MGKREHDGIPWLIIPHISILSVNTPEKMEKEIKMQRQTWVLSERRMIAGGLAGDREMSAGTQPAPPGDRWRYRSARWCTAHVA